MWALNVHGGLAAQLPMFEEAVETLTLETGPEGWACAPGPLPCLAWLPRELPGGGRHGSRP